MRGATRWSLHQFSPQRDFNPRSSCEERLEAADAVKIMNQFQSTLLMRGATAVPLSATSASVNFNPRSSCEERPAAAWGISGASYFNPRSSCEERLRDSEFFDSVHNFNPRSSCEERLSAIKSAADDMIFQSTLLMRGATACLCALAQFLVDFNPRSSCEERLCL